MFRKVYAVIVAALAMVFVLSACSQPVERVASEPVAVVKTPEAKPAPKTPAKPKVIAKPKSTPKVQAPVKVENSPVCEEDEPCWDCATMGNRVCGPQAAPVQTGPSVAAMVAEAKTFVSPYIIPMDERSIVTHLGWTTYDMTDGDDIVSVESKVAPGYWQNFKVVIDPAKIKK